MFKHIRSLSFLLLFYCFVFLSLEYSLVLIYFKIGINNEDIKNNLDKYPRVAGKPDPNIDFRRVPNLKVYFERNQINLTTDLNNIKEWQAGDIVVFGTRHIGMISDKRNKKSIVCSITKIEKFYIIL